MESIPCKQILSPLPQNLSSVGISTLELPSFPAGPVWNFAASSMAAHACSSDLCCFLEFVSQQTYAVVLNFLLLGYSLKFGFHSLEPSNTPSNPEAMPCSCSPFIVRFIHWAVLVGCLWRCRQILKAQYSSVSKKKKVSSVLPRQSAHVSGWTGSGVFGRKTITEILQS